MEKLYTVEQAAEILQVHPKTVREWLRTKKLKGVLAGRFWRIKKSDLEAFLHEPDDELPADTPSKTAPPKGTRRPR
jgi:excisionase family DNA binding protein